MILSLFCCSSGLLIGQPADRVQSAVVMIPCSLVVQCHTRWVGGTAAAYVAASVTQVPLK